MFIPAATALKNLVYRIIPTPGQAFHGSVTLTTFHFHFPYFFFLSFFSSPHILLSWEQKEVFCATDFHFWSVVRERQSGDNRWQDTRPLTVSCVGAVVSVMMFPKHVQWQTPCPVYVRTIQWWADGPQGQLSYMLPGSAVKSHFGLLLKYRPYGIRKPKNGSDSRATKRDLPTDWLDKHKQPETVMSHSTEWHDAKRLLISVKQETGQ